MLQKRPETNISMLITKRQKKTIAGIRHVQLSHQPTSLASCLRSVHQQPQGPFLGQLPEAEINHPIFGGNCQMVCNQVTGVSLVCHHVVMSPSNCCGTNFFGVKTFVELTFFCYCTLFLGQKLLFLVGCPKPPCFITGAEFLNNSVASLKDQIMNRSHPKAMTIAAARGTSSSPSTFNLYTTVLQFQQHRFNERNPKKKPMAWKEVPKRCIVPGNFGCSLSKFRSQKKTDGKKHPSACRSWKSFSTSQARPESIHLKERRLGNNYIYI